MGTNEIYEEIAREYGYEVEITEEVSFSRETDKEIQIKLSFPEKGQGYALIGKDYASDSRSEAKTVCFGTPIDLGATINQLVTLHQYQSTLGYLGYKIFAQDNGGPGTELIYNFPADSVDDIKKTLEDHLQL